ncbi:hypothetical protein Rsub_09155 [Raphidocelis subcapitata]|uniref:Uncharacterized protein n=1 Tax=Raphidocelis subcapitata TaxID=307507 RepID=A0A2V0PCA9_9CHLO|nr:hypothetical protein Rsub_09155 [Raphidocelis subcapitata]|eukprot:GBF96572.1 hypothetical protein Rsub_09155 [Raphidocelis subcapitata]
MPRAARTPLPDGRCALHRAGQRLRTRPKASGGGFDDDVTAAALEEAVRLVRAAQALAAQQVRAELLQSRLADSADGPDAAASAAAAAAFLAEQGLSARDAGAAIEALSSGGDEGGGGGGGGGAGGSPPSRAWLEAKFLSLGRLLPGADLASMVSKRPLLLRASSSQVVGALVALAAALPAADAVAVAEKRPGLLLLPDLAERCERAVSRLLRLHPSRRRRVVAWLVAEYPELIERMDYYPDATTLDDLPIEIQNMMLPGGQATIDWLYRYWAERDAKEAAGGGTGGTDGGGGGTGGG